MSKNDQTVRVIFIEHDGTEHPVDAKVGSSLMQVAVNNLVPGIEADCGGLCACATCHGYVDASWRGQLGAPSQGESDLLRFASNAMPESRLTCQLQVNENLDGMVIRLPASQY